MTRLAHARADGMAVAGPRYWLALCLASLLGADLGDLLAHDLGWGHWRGAMPLLALLAGALLMQRRSATIAGAWFWCAVVMLRAIATNLADLATHDLHLLQAPLLALLGLGLLAAGIGATPLRTGARFWLALFLAGTLGTVLGDDASHWAGLPSASLALAALLLAAFAVTTGADCSRPVPYWCLVLLARTAGTSVADLVAERSGLGLAGSTALIALFLAATIAVGRLRQRSTAAA